MIRSFSRSAPQAELETLLELGEGGMARAYLARALGAGGFQRLVVIKRLNLELLAVPDAIERFLAEARVAARIHHANVVGTQQIGRDATGPFIVLDYIEGGSLDDLVSESELPVPVVLRVALDALAGLQAVHEATDVDGRPLSILHRDISLQNILVSAVDGVARLSDFGVAKSALGKVDTDEGVLVGKLVYFPPEYLRRETVGPPLDLYALGVTLWLAMSREEPWHGASDAQIMREILDNGLPPLDRFAKLAPPIVEIVMRACDRDPQKRFRSAREMARALEPLDREHGLIASHTEVASVVSDVLGPALQLRRNAVLHLTRSGEKARSGKNRIALSPTLPASGGTARLPMAPRPLVLPKTRRPAPVARSGDAATPPRRSPHVLSIGALVAAAMAAGIAVGAWGFWGGDATDPVPVAPLDITVVSPPETLEHRGVKTTVSEPVESVEPPAPLAADAGAAMQTPQSRVRERSQTGRENVTRGAAAQEPLRRQNPYRKGAAE